MKGTFWQGSDHGCALVVGTLVADQKHRFKRIG